MRTTPIRRAALALGLALGAGLLAPVAASAHPLGNFSVNHIAQVRVSPDRVDVRYILDEAEIPTFQQRGVSDTALLARKRAEVERRLVLTVDGRRVTLQPRPGATITHPMGQGGLRTTRVELPLSAPIDGRARVELRDGTFPGRVGWRTIIPQPGRGTAVRADVPAGDPTDGLRRYPSELLSSPADTRAARLDVAPGTGTLTAPDGARAVARTEPGRADDGFTKVFSDAAAGEGVLLLLLLAALGWGAVHALSPGHGKAMVAAYLVGTRGRPRHALALGAMVTVTHTAGVFALGAITLALSEFVLPETLFPWLNLVSGLLVVVIGATVLRGHLRRRRAPAHAHQHHDTHDHDHVHALAHVHHHHADHAHADHDHAHHHPLHTHGHDHDHGHHSHHEPASRVRRAWRSVSSQFGGHHHHGDDHAHSHLPQEPGMRGLLAMGAAAGLIPCPSALVVLLGAVAQGQIALGMLLIVAFSVGLAATLTVLGLAVVLASRALRNVNVPTGLMTALPAASAVLIVAVGCALTINAIPLIA